MRDRKKDADRIIIIATWVSIVYMIVGTILIFMDIDIKIIAALQFIWCAALLALGILLTITNVKRRKEFSIDYELGQHIVKFYVTDRFIHATHTVNSDDSETVYRYTVDLKDHIIHCHAIDYNRPDNTCIYAFYDSNYGHAHEESKFFTTFDAYFDGLAWVIAKSSMPLGKDEKETYTIHCPHNTCDGRLITL